MSLPGPSSALDRARSKAFLHLLPLLFFCYVIAYVDRVNVSLAKLNMQEDLAHLGFSESAFGFGMGVFFIGYLLLAIPGTLLVEKWSARKWISWTMISWGIIAAMTAFVHYRVPGASAVASWIVQATATLLDPLAQAQLGWISSQARNLARRAARARGRLCVSVLGGAVPAGPGRGRVLSRRDRLPNPLVSPPRSFPGLGLVLHRNADRADCRPADLRCHHDHWRRGLSTDPWLGRLAVGLHLLGHPAVILGFIVLASAARLAS